VGALSRASSFLIGNWRWSTWGPFRETSQELVLAAGCLFFALRRIAATFANRSGKFCNAMADSTTKYPQLIARVSPALKEAVETAADRSGLTVSGWMRWVLVESTGLNIETDQKETSA